MKIEEEVRKLAAEYPEATYVADTSRPDAVVRCFYSSGQVRFGPETPGCIVGQAVRLVKPDFDLDEFDRVMGLAGVDELLPAVGIADPTDWLVAVQEEQDEGQTWAAAVQAADAAESVAA